MSVPSGSNTTYTIMFGLFLKLLGFFVVLYSYADFEPAKVQAVENSLKQRFNVALPSQLLQSKGGQHLVSVSAIQSLGRSFDELEKEMKTQVDFLSSKRIARTGTLILTLPADIILPLDGKPAHSPQFTQVFVRTLKDNQPKDMAYKVTVVAKGGQRDVLMRGIGDFVQNIIGQDYNSQLLTISYSDETDIPRPLIDLIIQAVPR